MDSKVAVQSLKITAGCTVAVENGATFVTSKSTASRRYQSHSDWPDV